MADTALDGLKVLEYGDFISAAYASKLMADLGADVIKIEPPGGDSARRHGPFPNDAPHPEKSGLYLFLNTNKRSVTLDAGAADGRRAFADLADWADIIIHNQRPQELEAQALSYETLSRDHPALVMVAITVFGRGTPYENWNGTALIATAGSGLSHRIGDRDRAPLWLPYCAADFQGGLHGAMTAMMALRARRLTGAGQHAWVSIIEILGTTLAGSGLANYVFLGQLKGRDGAHMQQFYPWQVTPVQDGYFEVITMVDAQWNRFVELMDNPPWREDERLQNRWLAHQWTEELDAFWHPWMKARSKAELWRLFRDNHIAFQPVQTIDEVAESDHLAARQFWTEIEHPIVGRYRSPGAPYRLSETPVTIRRPPPLLGQHNDEVYRGLLDYSPAHLRDLQTAGAI